MKFEYPHLLWLLLLTGPALGVFLLWAWLRRRQLVLRFVQLRLLPSLTASVSITRQKLRLLLLLLAALSLTVSLARPQWGFDWEEARQRGLDIVVAIDTSRSMLAEDVAPNRLGRAKLAALDLQKLARTDRLGLVAFAGSAFLQCPLSIDDDAFRQSVEALDVNIIPQGGTALAEAIRCAISAFKDKTDNYKVLLLFSDGEDHDNQAAAAARAAAEDGLRIFTIGVGTPGGELLRLVDPQGRTEYIKDDQGQVVKSRLHESLLQEIARLASGFYLPLAAPNAIDLLYERGLAPLPKSEFAAVTRQRFHEQFQWPLGFAILLLVSEMLLPERRGAPRPKTAAVTKHSPPWSKPGPAQALPLTLLAFLWPAALLASSSDALKKYQSGHYGAALVEYERALDKHPDDPRLQFNAGTAAFQARDYELAQKYFNSALATQDLGLQQHTYYNLGNAHYRQGEQLPDPAQRQQPWQQAVADYESALKLDPNDADAQYNLEFVKKRLEELQQQQQQQQQQQSQNQQDQEQKEQQNQSQQNQDKQDQSQDQSEQEKPAEQQQDQNQDDQHPGPPQQQQQQPEGQPPSQPQESQSQPGQSDQANQQPSEPSKEEPGTATDAKAIQMTPEQARQLLDTLRSEERPLIFLPESQKRPRERHYKNW